MVFVVIWLCSAGSPFLLGIALYKKDYKSIWSLLGVTIFAYLPWKQNSFTEILRSVYTKYSSQYMKRYKLVFVDGQGDDPKQQQRQTFYAIHPHGAFCMGWSFLYCSDIMQSVKFCFSPALCLSPFFRIFSRIMGNPGSGKFCCFFFLKRKNKCSSTFVELHNIMHEERERGRENLKNCTDTRIKKKKTLQILILFLLLLHTHSKQGYDETLYEKR